MTHRRLMLGSILLLSLLSACSTLPGKKPTQEIKPITAIGPFETFSGRLIVIEPRHRWQVTVQWQAVQPETGWARLTHASSNTIIELRWQDDTIELRGHGRLLWQPVSREELAKQGIVLTPRQLATFLLGSVPAHFQPAKSNNPDQLVWENRGFKPFIRVQWQQHKRRLTMTDITHGHRAILIIAP